VGKALRTEEDSKKTKQKKELEFSFLLILPSRGQHPEDRWGQGIKAPDKAFLM